MVTGSSAILPSLQAAKAPAGNIAGKTIAIESAQKRSRRKPAGQEAAADDVRVAACTR
jgi:hypothetical protein